MKTHLSFYVVVLLHPALGVAACPGTPTQVGGDHRLSLFETSSYVKATDKGRFEYSTCVENLTDEWLEFNWFVPGPNTWIEPNGLEDNQRIRTEDNDFGGMSSCLRYGPSYTTDRKEYLPPPGDVRLIEMERNNGCTIRPSQYDNAEMRVEGDFDKTSNDGQESVDFAYQIVVDVFAPSDREKAVESMAKITAYFSAIPEGSELIAYFVQLQAEEIGEASNPELITIMPGNSSIQRLLAAEDYPDGALPANLDGEISFVLPTPDRATLTDARYSVRDKNGMNVATLFMPLWVER